MINRKSKNDSWTDLPYDMQLTVMRHLKGNRVLRYHSVSKSFQKLLNDNDLWITYYQQEFGCMDFLENAKSQYLTALLFKEGMSVFNHRPDHGHILFQTINTWLDQFTNQPWAGYYLGMIHYFGTGVVVDKEKGLPLLISSFSKGDHRAAIAIAEFIIQASIDNENNQALNISNDVINALPSALLSAHQKGSPLAARLLGYCYLDGIGVKADINIAMTWFMEALKQNCDQCLPDIVWLISGKASTAMEEDNSEHQDTNDSAIEFLIKQKEFYPCSAEIDFQLGLLYLEVNEIQKAFVCFQSASEHHLAQAFRELGLIYLNHADQLDMMGDNEQNYITALECFRTAFENGDVFAGESLFNFLEDTDHDLVYFKDNFQQHPLLVVQLVNEHYAKLPIDLLAAKSEASIWLQLAAQFGNKDAFAKLSMLCEEQNAHAWVAMGIIYSVGSSAISEMTANAGLAKQCFENAIVLDPEAGKHYLEMAQKEDISGSLVLNQIKELVMSETNMSSSSPYPYR